MALLKKEGQIGLIYKLILSYERGNWINCSSFASDLGVNVNKILDIYVKALEWSNYIE